MVLSFSAFLLYSFISCINDVNGQSLYMLGNTLYTLPYLIIFLYFSHLNVVTNSIGTMSLYALPKKDEVCIQKLLAINFLYDLVAVCRVLLLMLFIFL